MLMHSILFVDFFLHIHMQQKLLLIHNLRGAANIVIQNARTDALNVYANIIITYE